MIEGPLISKADAIKQGLQFLLILAIVFFILQYTGLDGIQQKLIRAGMWGPIILILLKALTLIFAPLSGSPLYPIAGLLYGFTESFIYMFIGDTIGSVVTFYLSRIYGKPIVRYFLGSAGNTVEAILEYLGTQKGLIQARLFFFSFPEGVSYAAGLTKINFLRFIIIQMGIAIVPIALMVSLGSILVGQSEEGIILAISAVAIIAAGIGGWWFYTIAKKHKKK